MPKIWVGRTTLKGEKKEYGLSQFRVEGDNYERKSNTYERNQKKTSLLSLTLEPGNKSLVRSIRENKNSKQKMGGI